MVLGNSSNPTLSILFGVFALTSLFIGIAFWRTRNLITSVDDDLVFRGFWSQFSLPANSVKSIHTEAKMGGTYKLVVQTASTIYRLSIPAPNGPEWAQLRQRLDNHDTFPHHLN